MMKSISILSLFLALFLSISLTAAATGNLVEKACADSTQKSLCQSVLDSKPEAKNSDLRGLAFLALKTAADTAVNTSTHVKALLIMGGINEPELEDGLNDCSDYYLDVVDQINDSIDALISKNFTNVNTWVSAAIADVGACNEDMHGLTAPAAKEMVEKNRKVSELCKNALEVAAVFQHNSD